MVLVYACYNGDRVSKTLAERLNTATEYYHENPEIVIVVSGGQGEDEWVSEAFAMQRYLIARGVNEKNILLEDKSTSTKENFDFSKIVLDEYFGGETYTSAYVTNDFHCYRAGWYAEMAGLSKDYISARTPILLFPAYCARDYLGVMHFIMFGR